MQKICLLLTSIMFFSSILSIGIINVKNIRDIPVIKFNNKCPSTDIDTSKFNMLVYDMRIKCIDVPDKIEYYVKMGL